MAEISRAALFGRLNSTSLKAIETATSFCKMRGIYVGFQMEINANGQRFVSNPVESIGIVL